MTNEGYRFKVWDEVLDRINKQTDIWLARQAREKATRKINITKMPSSDWFFPMKRREPVIEMIETSKGKFDIKE